MPESETGKLRREIASEVEKAYKAGYDDGVKIGRDHLSAEIRCYEQGKAYGRWAVEKIVGEDAADD